MKKTFMPLAAIALLLGGFTSYHLTSSAASPTTSDPTAVQASVYSSPEAIRHLHGDATHWRSFVMR